MTRERPTTIRLSVLAENTGIASTVISHWGRTGRATRLERGLYAIDKKLLDALENYEPRSKRGRDSVRPKIIRNFVEYHRPYVDAQEALRSLEDELETEHLDKVIANLLGRVEELSEQVELLRKILGQYNHRIGELENAQIRSEAEKPGLFDRIFKR